MARIFKMLFQHHVTPFRNIEQNSPLERTSSQVHLYSQYRRTVCSDELAQQERLRSKINKQIFIFLVVIETVLPFHYTVQ